MIDPAIEKFIQENLHESLEKVIFKVRDQLAVDPDFVIAQINGRKKVQKKVPSWAVVQGLQFPSVLSFEQCSSESTARYKAALIQGQSMLDLTGGFGVDSFFLSKNFTQVDYVEKNEALLALVKENFECLKATNITLHLGDGIAFLDQQKEKVDWIYVDPSRRNVEKGKVFLMEDCEPDMVAHLALFLSKAHRLLIKFSPMLDLEEIIKKLPGVSKIIVLSVKNECKELLVQVDGVERSRRAIILEAVDIHMENQQAIFTSNAEERNNTKAIFGDPQTYIYEPNKAILKAGLQNHLAESLQLKKLAANSNFFSSDKLVNTFPGRIFLKKDKTKGKEKWLRKHLLDGKANVIARNYPLNAAQIYQRFKIVPGGTNYLLATTLENGEKIILVCERLK